MEEEETEKWKTEERKKGPGKGKEVMEGMRGMMNPEALKIR